MVGATLVACQIDEGNLAEGLLAFLEDDLEDGVRSRRLGVGGVLGGDSLGGTVLHEVAELATVGDITFFETDNVNVLLVVLSYFEFVALVEQVEKLATVNLEKSKFGLQVTKSRLSIIRVVRLPNRRRCPEPLTRTVRPPPFSDSRSS